MSHTANIMDREIKNNLRIHNQIMGDLDKHTSPGRSTSRPAPTRHTGRPTSTTE